MPNPSTSTAPKRPFQDITERFVSPRPKRKPKTPGGALGEKLRLRIIETTKSKSNAFPSSLPPSSPPLYSESSVSEARGVPLRSSQREVHDDEGDEGEEPHGYGYGYGHDDFGSLLPSDDDADADAENRAPTPAPLSDPFGFFAVERRLKAERKILPPPPPAARPTDDKERDDGRVMPSTPHKPKVGKSANSNPNVFSPATTSLVSSPSPVKTGDRRRTRADADEDDDDDENAPPTRKKARPNPEAAAPRRSTRGKNSIKAEKAAPASKPKPKTRPARKAPAKAAGKATAKAAGKKKEKAVETNDDADDEQAEKFEAERQARLEYFKRLEDYSFEKENVYVV
ncbi:hypothetical protein B0H17DRAFT_1122760 [Mycena rosella]|uniref:Uncharacterized protein n=1 Tax=Mycena rosella TaxID=1033263 RepID=A0AAD7AWM8_MYCRO|nr:hypothetical protein B0H17DRAFT_1122760 [Mycena rosella]